MKRLAVQGRHMRRQSPGSLPNLKPYSRLTSLLRMSISLRKPQPMPFTNRPQLILTNIIGRSEVCNLGWGS